MPNLWNDYTTDEAAEACTYTHRSAIVRRIHQNKQAATKAQMPRQVYGKHWRYWITQDELDNAVKSWPKYAKKRKQEELPSAAGQAACNSLPCQPENQPLTTPSA